jgi:lysophospholipase L1-like esterase
MKTAATLRSLLLAAAPVLAVAACAQDDGWQNVALGKSFTCSSPGGIAWQGLTDGERESDEPPGCFATGPDPDYPKKVVIDLGAVYEVEQIIVHSGANGNTAKVEVWASRDGVTYERMRLPYTFPNKIAQSMSAKFPPRATRYVKVALLDSYGGGLGGDHVLFLREVEVIGRATAATAQTRSRPKTEGPPPRAARLFRAYALRPQTQLRLLVIGDESGFGAEGGLGGALAAKLQQRFSLAGVEVTDRCEPGYTARRAAIYPISLADESPDLVVVSLGTADSLAFSPAEFRAEMDELLTKLLERTHAMIVVVAPPPLPHAATLPRAEDVAGADTADAAWQLAGLVKGRDIAFVDAAEALGKSGLDVTDGYVDNLTLTAEGHAAVADAIVEVFR